MKKIFIGVFGVIAIVFGANADIKTATTNTVKRSVYNINYGENASPSAAAPTYGYRSGVIPQTKKLTTAQGTSLSSIDNVTVGNLASVSTAAGSVATSTNSVAGSGHVIDTTYTQPTATIAANADNIAVLQRDKLVTPQTGNCTSNSFKCGYVTTGSHANTPNTNDKVWMMITKCRKKSTQSGDCTSADDCECTVNGTNWS